MVDSFTYLGASISSDGEIKDEVAWRIAKACRAFGCLRGFIFQNGTFSVTSIRTRQWFLSVLLYGAETWTLKAEQVRHLSSFHNRCNRFIFGVTRYQQWEVVKDPPSGMQ